MKSKTKIMTIAAASLACIAVAGVGFASWVITNQAGDEVGGNFKVETVDDQRIELDAEIEGDQISFTYDRTNVSQTDWLGKSDDAVACNLDATITLTVNGANNASAIDIAFEVTEGEVTDTSYTAQYNGYSWVADVNGKATTYEQAVSSGFITAPKYYIDGSTEALTGNSITINTNDETDEITIRVAFGWGTKFGGVNPADHYNANAYTKEMADQADEYLTYLEKCLTDVTYKITLTPVAST